MANISIKDVPDSMAEALRQRAVRNHRSLQGELMAIIEAAVAETATAKISATTADREARKQRLFALMENAAPYTAGERLSRDEANRRR